VTVTAGGASRVAVLIGVLAKYRSDAGAQDSVG
jgi:hypothetical protein